MSKELIEQLRHPNPLKRRAAIIELARTGRSSMQQYLIAVTQHDPIPELRTLAGKAIQHLDKVKHHQQPAGLRRVPPGRHPSAEAHFLRALDCQRAGDWADSWQHLSKTIAIDPLFASDPGLRELAVQITGYPAEQAVDILRTPAKSQAFFREKVLQGSSYRWPISRGVVFSLFLVLMLVNVLLEHGPHLYSITLQNWHVQQWKQQTYTTNDNLPYYVVKPTGNAPKDGWPTLIAIHDRDGSPDNMLGLFGDTAEQTHMLLIVPDFGAYQDTSILPRLDTLLSNVAWKFSVHRDGPVLFGYSTGGEIASLYVRRHPFAVAGLVTSSATYLYPPPAQRPNIDYTIIYGGDDILLQDSSDTYVQFADIDDWDRPLNYAVIPGLGHELSEHHVTLTLDTLNLIYNGYFD